MIMGKIFYPPHSVRCVITGFSDCGRWVFLANLILNINKEYDNFYIYSPSLHQRFYQTINNCYSTSKPNIIITEALNEDYIDLMLEEIVNHNDFEKSYTE